MKLTKRVIGEATSVRLEFFSAGFNRHSSANEELLIVSCESDSSVNWRDTAYIKAMLMAAAEFFQPIAIILNFGSLKYNWGDSMSEILQCARRTELSKEGVIEEKVLPTVIVTSRLNRSSFESLISSETDKNPNDVIHDTLDKAAEALERVLYGSS